MIPEPKDRSLLIKAWRDTLRKGDYVEVRDRKWRVSRSGKVLNVTSRGCGVLYDGNHDGFAYWNDIFPTSDVLETIEKKFYASVKNATVGGATIGDVVRIQGGVRLRVVPPNEEEFPRARTVLPSMVRIGPPVGEPIPEGHSSVATVTLSSAAEPPPCVEKNIQPAKVIVVKQPKAEPPPATALPLPAFPETKPAARTFKRGEGRAAHALTDIAILLRTERIRRGETQREACVMLNISAPVLSRIELGMERPTDDHLLCYADFYNMDLNTLLRARDGQEENATVPAEKEEKPDLRFIGTVVPNKSVQDTEPPNERLDWFLDVIEFTERLKLAIPFPTDTEKRRAWYKAALKFFEVNNGS